MAGQPPEDQRESDRLRLQLERTHLQIEVSNVVVSKLSLKDLLVAVSDLLKRFINHDFASVVLYNEERQELRVHALDKPPPGGLLGEGAILPLEGSPPGLAIRTRTTIRRAHLDLNDFHAPMVRLALLLHDCIDGCEHVAVPETTELRGRKAW
jgi:hypothetical protein